MLTEDNDAQEEVFFKAGSRRRQAAPVRLGAHQSPFQADGSRNATHLLATAAPEELLAETPTNYRRWWNNSWYEVEEGGQHQQATGRRPTTARLKALVDHAHKLGFWIRFYTLDGFAPGAGSRLGQRLQLRIARGREARWNAALEAGVNLIATDQYEDLAAFMRQH